MKFDQQWARPRGSTEHLHQIYGGELVSIDIEVQMENRQCESR